MEKYKYNAFGLVIESEFKLPELLQCETNSKPDIEIIFGKVPLEIENIIEKTIGYQISKTEFLFNIDGVSCYYVKNGRCIIIELFDNYEIESIKAYLMGTAIGMALLQRKMVPIHGSSVVIDGKCVIFTGDCGAGKSTICAALRKQGYEFLSDDVSVIDLNGDIPMVVPSFPQQKLCRDTAKQMGYDVNDLSLVCNADDKYLINNLKNFREEATELAAIIEIIPEENCEVEITKVVGFQKAENVMKNIYCNVILNRIGMEPEYFKKCLKISNLISFYQLKRPINIFTVVKQIELVKKVSK